MAWSSNRHGIVAESNAAEGAEAAVDRQYDARHERRGLAAEKAYGAMEFRVIPEAPPTGEGPTCETSGVVAPIIAAITAFQGIQALKILAGRHDAVARGLYCVDLPLVQEFVPARMRGFIGGLVTVFIPLGVMISSALAAFISASEASEGSSVLSRANSV